MVSIQCLYSRCHLLGYQFIRENANVKNLITGARYINIEGMLSFENKVANYVKSTRNHVLFRVAPVFEGENLLVAGVLMEALSAEDAGTGLEFCVFAYNVQPYIDIDYSTGVNARSADAPTSTSEPTPTPKPPNQETTVEKAAQVSSEADYRQQE